MKRTKLSLLLAKIKTQCSVIVPKMYKNSHQTNATIYPLAYWAYLFHNWITMQTPQWGPIRILTSLPPSKGTNKCLTCSTPKSVFLFMTVSHSWCAVPPASNRTSFLPKVVTFDVRVQIPKPIQTLDRALAVSYFYRIIRMTQSIRL